jgi:hypothetical protein
MVSATASRTSALSNGGLVRLSSAPTDSLVALSWQTACGACDLTSLSNANVTVFGKVMSKLPAAKASIAVERFGMIEYSTPSR